jgi:hypothetical protein
VRRDGDGYLRILEGDLLKDAMREGLYKVWVWIYFVGMDLRGEGEMGYGDWIGLVGK